jgi:hypothetical protein
MAKKRRKRSSVGLHPMEARVLARRQEAEKTSKATADRLLANFVDAEVDDGRLESQGEFTLSPEKAIAKRASFALPFEGAWAVKLVQAVVASGTDQPIAFVQDRRQTTITFQPGRRWSVREIEDSFYDPALGACSDLDHLKAALWVLTLAQQREVILGLPGDDPALVWSGERWESTASSGTTPTATLTVSHGPRSAQSSLSERQAHSRRSCAEESAALNRRCFVCPVPLLLDGRRLDALQNCPGYGYSEIAIPLVLGFTQGDLPEFPCPQATLDWRGPRVPKSDMLPVEEALDQAALGRPTGTGLAFQLSYQVSKGTSGFQSTYRPREVRSSCHWVVDGAVIATESFDVAASPYAVGAYISAAGLATDLTGFALLESQEKARRFQLAGGLVAQALSQSDTASLKATERYGRITGRLAGGMVTLLGGPFLLAAGGALSAIAITGLFGAMGWCIARARRSSYEKVLAETRDGLRKQSKVWLARYPYRPAKS